MTDKHRIECLFLSQEDLLQAGCLDMRLAMSAAENAMLAYEKNDILFPEKVVQIFNEDTQERINCLPATLLPEKICGAKWVSVFPFNPEKYGQQNLSAVFILSEIEKGYPIAFMDGTLCSNMRVGAMGAIAARHFARPDSKSIAFIGAGEQAKMHLIAMKTVFPALEECRVSAKYDHEEQQFIDEMATLFQDMRFSAAHTNAQRAIEGADILVTATSAQAPLLKAAWIKPGTFYSHIGGWEDEYDVAKQCDKIVCDDWETVKHRTQTLSRMYKDGQLSDEDIREPRRSRLRRKRRKGDPRRTGLLQRSWPGLCRCRYCLCNVSTSQRSGKGAAVEHPGDHDLPAREPIRLDPAGNPHLKRAESKS